MLCRIASAGFRKRFLRLFRWWLLVSGLSVGAVGFAFAAYTSVFLLLSTSTKGTIVRLEPIEDQNDGTTNYAPVFSFSSQDRQTHVIRSIVSSNPSGFEVGEVVRVLYIKSNPEGAKIGSFLQLWFVAIICSVLGLLFGVPGYLLFRYERKRRRQVLASASSGTMMAQ